jgi:hypothetical protein
MPEPLLPCPGCGNPGKRDYCGHPCCPDCGCGFMASRDETWNKRAPGPATQAMLEQAGLIVKGGVGSKWMDILKAFINEWK